MNTASEAPENVYAPPRAVVSDPAPTESATLPFLAVSPLKLVIMCLGTFTFYQLYWIYKNWRLYQQRTGDDIWPAARTIFGVFFIYQLFKQINVQAQQRQVAGFAAGLAAIGWIVLSLMWNLPGAFGLLPILSTFCLVPAQLAASRVNDAAAPGHDQNSRLKGWNWLAVVLGLPFLAMAVFGAFLPQP